MPQLPNMQQPKKPQVDPQLRASLLALLNLMKNKAEKEDLQPIIKTHKLIDLLKTSGITLSYHQLRDLASDKMIQPLIKDINKDQTTLRLDSDDDDEIEAPMDMGVDNPEEMPQDDFSGEDDFDQTGDEPAPDADDSYDEGPTGHSGKSIISGMAKRALARS
jgi:hypothetical protein